MFKIGQEERWPMLDKSKTNGACKNFGKGVVIVDKFDSVFEMKCSKYCDFIGMDCAGAWEENNDKCSKQYTANCNGGFRGSTSDAICQCKARVRISPTRRPTVLIKTKAPTFAPVEDPYAAFDAYANGKDTTPNFTKGDEPDGSIDNSTPFDLGFDSTLDDYVPTPDDELFSEPDVPYDACAAGYVQATGQWQDIGGWGDEKMTRASQGDCSSFCNARSWCTSYEWSDAESSNNCVLNRGRAPNEAQYRDYIFCQKDAGVVNDDAEPTFVPHNGTPCGHGFKDMAGGAPADLRDGGGSVSAGLCRHYCAQRSDCRSFMTNPNGHCNLSTHDLPDGYDNGTARPDGEWAFCQKTIDSNGAPTPAPTCFEEGAFTTKYIPDGGWNGGWWTNRALFNCPGCTECHYIKELGANRGEDFEFYPYDGSNPTNKAIGNKEDNDEERASKNQWVIVRTSRGSTGWGNGWSSANGIPVACLQWGKYVTAGEGGAPVTAWDMYKKETVHFSSVAVRDEKMNGAQCYCQNWPDLRAAYCDGSFNAGDCNALGCLDHWNANGQHEGRTFGCGHEHLLVQLGATHADTDSDFERVQKSLIQTAIAAQVAEHTEAGVLNKDGSLNWAMAGVSSDNDSTEDTFFALTVYKDTAINIDVGPWYGIEIISSSCRRLNCNGSGSITTDILTNQIRTEGGHSLKAWKGMSELGANFGGTMTIYWRPQEWVDIAALYDEGDQENTEVMLQTGATAGAHTAVTAMAALDAQYKRQTGCMQMKGFSTGAGDTRRRRRRKKGFMKKMKRRVKRMSKKAWKIVSKIVEKAGKDIKAGAKSLKKAVNKAGKAVSNLKAKKWIKGVVKGVVKAANAVANAVKEVGNAIADGVKNAIKAVGAAIEAAIAWLKDFLCGGDSMGIGIKTPVIGVLTNPEWLHCSPRIEFQFSTKGTKIAWEFCLIPPNLAGEIEFNLDVTLGITIGTTSMNDAVRAQCGEVTKIKDSGHIIKFGAPPNMMIVPLFDSCAINLCGIRIALGFQPMIKIKGLVAGDSFSVTFPINLDFKFSVFNGKFSGGAGLSKPILRFDGAHHMTIKPFLDAFLNINMGMQPPGANVNVAIKARIVPPQFKLHLTSGGQRVEELDGEGFLLDGSIGVEAELTNELCFALDIIGDIPKPRTGVDPPEYWYNWMVQPKTSLLTTMMKVTGTGGKWWWVAPIPLGGNEDNLCIAW